MFRTRCLIGLIIVSLLACPLRCWGVIGVVNGVSKSADSKSAKGCSCCFPGEHETCPDQPRDDRLPCNDGGGECPDCLCDGAILAWAKPLVDFSPVAPSLPGAILPSDSQHGPQTSGERPAETPLPVITGRDLCQRHRLLLI